MIDSIKEGITLGIIFPIIMIAGSYLSYRLRFIQLTKLGRAVRLITTKESAGAMSSFSALAAVLGGNLGTGNISGVAVALVAGGPGSLFWMWVMAILASITKYVGCYLGVHYQRQNKVGDWVGGPMFYLRDGLKSKLLASLFCLLTISSALTVGNLVQVHALSLPLRDVGVHPLVFGLLLAVSVGGVIFGGLKRFAHVVSALVPFMAAAYILTCIVILFLFRDHIGHFLLLIVKSAFEPAPAAGGFLGYGILTAIRSGFDRGLFATDSGVGLAPIIHSSVRDTRPHHDNRVTQGLISLLSPMIVMVVCTMTGLVLLSTGAYEKVHLPSTTMCMEAFRIGFNHEAAGHVVSITLFFFAYTTILTWFFCASRAVEFLWSDRFITPFRIIFIAAIPYGFYVHDQAVWVVADLSINLMFIINIIGVIFLSGMVIANKQVLKN